ncbi:MAG: undecaprenyl-diphosphatase UppP [Anaerolineales bacterium]
MSLSQIVLLGILQGATEFLPISSSGHLVIVPYLLGWTPSSLAVDTVLHLGTLVAILIYFRRELLEIGEAWWQSLRTRSGASPAARLAWLIILGSVPAALIGFLLEDWFESLFARPRAAALFLLGTAALLVLSEYLARRSRRLESMSWREALFIGLAQSLAIAPGLSRSGSTIAAGLILGYQREDATRFSFLLAVPIVLGSGLYQLLQLTGGNDVGVSLGGLALGFLAAALTGYAAIAGLLALVKRRSLWPFALYCAALGLLVLTGALG